MRILTAVVITTFWWVAGAGACAQPPAAEPSPAKTATGVQEAKPELYYLKDKDGNLQPVLGFTLADFDRLITQDRTARQGPSRPAYRLDKIVASGTATAASAELKIRFTVIVDEAEWVRVPLRLGGTVLRDKVNYEGPGQYRLEFDEQTEEYVAWLRGKDDKPHSLELTVLTPLTTVAGESRLKLSLPRAWSSELIFTAPVGKATGQVTSGAALETTKSTDKSTEFRVLGLGNDFALDWRQGTVRPVSVAAVLEATGALAVRVDGRSLHTRAQLSVRSFGGEFESFRVRLPKGAILITEDSPEYSLVPVTTPGGKKDAALVEVRLKHRTAGPVSVALETEQPAAVSDKPTPVELSGFEVVGAVRQWGHVAVEVDGEWQLLWDGRRMVRQVDSLPDELAGEHIVAGFEYFAQPFLLAARIVAKQSRVYVEPQHVLQIHADRANLTTRLKFRVGGARVHEVKVDLGDWKIDDVEPPTLVNQDQLVIQQSTPLTIPFRQGTAGEFEITVHSHRDFDATMPVAWNMPRLPTVIASPAQIILVPDDEIDLEVLDAGTSSVVRQYIKPTVELPPRQQSPLVFHATADDPAIATKIQLRQRSVTVGVDAKVDAVVDHVDVQTHINYQIARQAIDHVTLQVPSKLLESGQLDVLVDETPLTWTILADPQRDPEGPVRIRVSLPSPKIGALRLLARYAVMFDKPLGESLTTIALPLVMPAEGEFRGADMVVISQDSISVHPADGFWTVQEAPTSISRLQLTSRVPRAELTIGLHARPVPQVTTIIERCWLQTYLTSQGRFDRVAMTVVAGSPQLTVQLPAGATSPELTINGEPISLKSGQTADQMVIPLAGVLTRQQVEIAYRLPNDQPSMLLGPCNLAAPQFGAGVWVQQTYWQVVLPPENHLVSFSGPLTSEQTWAWHGWQWGRWPLLTQSELEAWAGAPPHATVPEQAHQYLFATRGDIKRLTLVTSRRSLLVLLGAGGALAFGLSLIYWPRLRTPAVALATVLLVCGVTLLYPEPSLVIAQVAIPGLALAAMSNWLKRRVLRRASPSTLSRSGTHSSVIDRVSTRNQVPARPSSAPSPSSTATVQLNAPSLSNSSPSPGLDS